MGRLTGDLRSEGMCSGGDYELQGSDAKKTCGVPVTAQVNGTMVGPDGPPQQMKPSVSPDSLKSRVGPESI